MKPVRLMSRFFCIVAMMMWLGQAAGQDVEQVAKSDPWISNGSLTMSNIFSWPSDSLSKEQAYSYYISGALNTTFFGVVSVPMSFSYTNNDYASTIAYPFNRFSLAPSYKWIKTYIGFSSMTFSQYTLSGREFMGGGVELTPPDVPVVFSAFYGRFNKAVDFDSATMKPIYRRLGGGVLVGYNGERLSVKVNAIRVADDKESLKFADSDTNYIAPQGNVAFGIEVSANPFENTSVSAQYTMSIVDTDIASKDSSGTTMGILDDEDDTYRYSAYKLSASHSFGIGSLGASLERVSPNYMSFGSYYNTDDFQNVTLDFTVRIGKFANISGNVGFQHDNLDGQDVNTNSQTIYNCSLQLTPFERFVLSGSISNIQSYVYIKDIIEKVTETNQYQNLDTLSYTELNFNANGNVSYSFGDQQVLPQSVTVGYTYQRASHEQDNCDKYIDTKLHNINASYQITHAESKTSLSLSGNFNRTQNTIVTDVLTYGATLSNSFVKNLNVSVGVTCSNVSSEKNYDIINARATLSYSLLEHHSVSMNITSLNNNSQSRGTQYSANLTYSYNFSCGRKHVEEEGNKKWFADF